MKFKFRGFATDEIDIKMNNIKLEPNAKVDINPRFGRELKIANENPRIHIFNLTLRIENTALEPKPFDLFCNVKGIFEIEEMTDEERKIFVVEATRIIYPYLRSMVTQITTAAFLPPIVLPMIDGAVLFNEDRNINNSNNNTVHTDD